MNQTSYENLPKHVQILFCGISIAIASFLGAIIASIIFGLLGKILRGRTDGFVHVIHFSNL